MPAVQRNRFLSWVLPVVLAMLGFGLARLKVSEGLERRLLDARFELRGPRSVADSPLRIVTVDDQTFSDLQVKWPFRGSLYAHLIENLNRAGSRLIVFDIEFSEPNPLYPQDDSLFARAIENAGNVILSGKIVYQYNENLSAPYASLMPPIPVLQETGAPWGIINELTDPDDFIRRYLLYLPYENGRRTSLGLKVLRAMYGWSDTVKVEALDGTCRFGDLEIPLYDRHSFLINYFGPAGTFPPISLSSVLDDSTFSLGTDRDSDYMEQFFHYSESTGRSAISNPFAGKIVLIGAAAEELHDNKNTPFYDFERTPRRTSGVEVHAHALQTILDKVYIWRTPPLFILLLDILLAIIIFQLVGAVKPLRGLGISSILVFALIAFTFLSFAYWNLWSDMVSPLAAVIAAYLGASIYYYLLERRERVRIQNMFAHYVPDKVLAELISKPELLKLGGERRRLTMLFADIEGFTSISETLNPEALVSFLNEYMTSMTEIIHVHQGIIDKYEGDLIMAEFGAPVYFADHARNACLAALKMQENVYLMRSRWAQEGKPEIRIRIGINTGQVIIGNLGSRDLFDYTVLGDAVNLCARLEEANKLYGTGILISRSTREEIPATMVTRDLGDLRVRGRGELVRVFELLAEEESKLVKEQRELLSLFQQGFTCFQSQDWRQAISYFEKALAIVPHDQPSRFLLERCRKFDTNPPGADWEGIIIMQET